MAMGEEVRITDDDERVAEWEAGLPSDDDLTPLSLPLVSSALAAAFSISPEPHRSASDVHRASQDTISSLRSHSNALFSANFKSFREEMECEDTDLTGSGSDQKRTRTGDAPDEEFAEEDSSARTVKRPRLVWTPQLHKRFVDVVAHLGVKNAVPKTIMQLMNVEGLTRENVASHLQKYRLYLKRMQGCSNEAPTASDQLFASTPVPQSLRNDTGTSRNGNGGHMQAPLPIPMPYPPHMVPMMVPMPPPHGFDSYNQMMHQQQRDWAYHHMNSNDK